MAIERDRVKKLIEKLKKRREVIFEEYVKSLESSDDVAIGSNASSNLRDEVRNIEDHLAELHK